MLCTNPEWLNDYLQDLQKRIAEGRVLMWSGEPVVKECMDPLHPDRPLTYWQMGKYVIANFEQFGVADWTGWAEQHWGTSSSWDAAISADGLAVTFYTAWSWPEPLIKTLFNRFPKTDMLYTFAEEQFDWWCGMVVRGQQVRMYLPEEDSFDAFVIAASLWDPEQDDYRWSSKENRIIRLPDEEETASQKTFSRLKKVNLEEELNYIAFEQKDETFVVEGPYSFLDFMEVSQVEGE